MDANRRTVLKSAGAAAGASLFATTGAAAETVAATLDEDLDTGTDARQGVLIVFEPGADFAVLDRFDLPAGTYEMDALDIVYTRAGGSVIERIATLEEVRYVEANRELEYHNGDAQVATGAGEVQERFDLGYTGDGVHVAVIDSGVDAYHPDLQDRLRHNYQFQDPLSADTAWTDVGVADTDDIGHGTHCAGSVAGEGNRNPEHEGMAPDADLTVYSTGAGLFILNAVAAYNHLLGNHAPGVAEGDEVVHITSNSYGSSGGNDFNPAGSQETATWRAFDAGITVVSSAGNSGPGTNTLGGAKTAPYILCIAASHDGQGEGMDATTKPTDFSSRGRTRSYDEGEGTRWDEFGNETRGYDARDRKTALENVRAFHEGDATRETLNERTRTVTVGPGTDAGGIAGGPGVGSSTFVDVTPEAGGTALLDVEVSWTPNQQDLDLFLHVGSEDGEVVASSTSGTPGERLQKGIESGQDYVLEINPWANVTSQAEVTVREKGPAQGADVSGPYGVYRPSVIAPGSAVVSTMGASALKALEPNYGATPADTGAFYSALSGTSMSCPVTAGVVAQVVEAYYRNNGGDYPDPETVIRLIEGGADADAEAVYTPYNAGAGLVDAVASAEFAEAGQVPNYSRIDLSPLTDDTVSVEAAGTREDDGRAFTAGATNQVTVTVTDLSREVDVARETLPEGWTVVGTGDGVRRVSDTEVRFDADRVNRAAGDGSAEFTFFVEAPSSPDGSNQYTLGPSEVRIEASGGGSGTEGFVPVAGTSSTEYVLGIGTGSEP